MKSGSSYLSRSEAAADVRRGEAHDRVERVVITWPSGRTEEFKGRRLLRAQPYECVEGEGLTTAAM